MSEDNEQTKLIREFPVELSEGDGRTVEARIVPYNVITRVSDGGAAYDEEFLPGAFEKQLNAANRVKVLLNFEHQPGLQGVVGHGTELVDKPDGLHGTFRIHETPDGDKALHLVREGILGSVSLEALALRNRRVNGVVQRVKAHLDKVALARTGLGAYKEAQVLAVRTAPAAVEPAPMSDEMLERLASLGIEPLRRLKIVKGKWDGSPARYTDEQYQRATLIDRGGDAPVKDRCSLPVLEPDGSLNVNAMAAAAAALGGARGGLRNVSIDMKRAAARKLMRYYRAAGMDPPPAMMSMAGG